MPHSRVSWETIAAKAGYTSEKEMLTDMYCSSPGLGMSISAISRQLGWSHFAVGCRLRHHNIPIRKQGRQRGFVVDKGD